MIVPVWSIIVYFQTHLFLPVCSCCHAGRVPLQENVMGSVEAGCEGSWLPHPEEQLFLDQLFTFMDRQGSPIHKVPNLGFKKSEALIFSSLLFLPLSLCPFLSLCRLLVLPPCFFPSFLPSLHYFYFPSSLLDFFTFLYFIPFYLSSCPLSFCLSSFPVLLFACHSFFLSCLTFNITLKVHFLPIMHSASS